MTESLPMFRICVLDTKQNKINKKYEQKFENMISL